MTDKTLSWAIAEIEAKMAKAVGHRKYYLDALTDPKNKDERHYLAFAVRMRHKWDGRVLGLEAARRIVVQVNVPQS